MKKELQKALGLRDEDFDSHESDLYVIDTPAVRAWLKANYEHWSNCSSFTSRTNGVRMIDIPFQNDAFWDKVARAVGLKAFPA